MSRYFVAATDYGPDNDKYPRWRVYAWSHRREPWGHIPNVPVSGSFWTAEEAAEELRKIEVGWEIAASLNRTLAGRLKRFLGRLLGRGGKP